MDSFATHKKQLVTWPVNLSLYTLLTLSEMWVKLEITVYFRN